LASCYGNVVTEGGTPMIDLRPYVGKTVCVQLKGPFLMMGANKGAPVPVLHEVKDPQSGAKVGEDYIRTPYILGDVVEMNGAFLVKYEDEVSKAAGRPTRNKLMTELSSDMIASITVVIEEKIVLLGQ